jgi:DNA-binding PadR family transcriptional regulator
MQIRKLSELEGAILSEIEHRGQKTAFQVRKAFAESFSLEWKGSAGAIYPAVRRLEHDGLLQASAAQGGRATRRLSLTEPGRQALKMWSCDPILATSIGVDPFRLRAGIWATLSKQDKKTLSPRLEQAIQSNIMSLQAYLNQADPVERIRIEMALAVQKDRLANLP